MALPVNAAREAAERTVTKVQPQQLRGRTAMKANRIQELINLSGITVREYYDDYGSTLAELQKFAKLIVRECLNKIELEAAQYAEPVWAFELVNDIKEHFGVTE